MVTWKRDFASGLIVLAPVILAQLGAAWAVEFVRVILTLAVFLLVVLAVGYLMRTAIGSVVESRIDRAINRLPGLRMVYNASKMAAETALAGTDSLQEPVKIEPWDGMQMTAFRTGKRTDDGRVVVFMPTAPNITTGFVIEVDEQDITETDEQVEDALTRLLSAGFGDSRRGADSPVPGGSSPTPDSPTPDIDD